MSEEFEGGRICPIFPRRGSRAVVLCDGPPPPSALLSHWLDGAELFVCTDGAGYPYSRLPRRPDLVIGDMDSLDARIIDGRHGPRFLCDSDQQTTDSEKALAYLANEGFAEAVLLGAAGRRLDHTLYNCFLLEKFADRLRLCLAGYDADVVRVAAGADVRWDVPSGTTFSLLPVYGRAAGVTVAGAVWPLDDVELGATAGAAVSNQVLVPPLCISVTSGSLLVTVSRADRFGT